LKNTAQQKEKDKTRHQSSKLREWKRVFIFTDQKKGKDETIFATCK
jgi:hypothetical protein